MKIIITGGGTAGHVNPGIAIAKYIQNRHKEAQILFVGTKDGIEGALVKKAGFDFKTVDVIGLSRSLNLTGINRNFKAVKLAVSSIKQAKKIISDFDADIVIGCGGYVSFPMVYAGGKLNVKTVILEVNIFPGITTKILSKSVDKILLSFNESKKYLDKNVLSKTIVTGSPISEDFNFCEKNNEKPLVVSFWGSMGALYMNKKMVDFINLKDDSFDHVHATGKTAFEWFKRDTNAGNSQICEYIFNMSEMMKKADLVICRGGAATLSELAKTRTPSIIVPSPYVAENHQEKNARIIEKAGGCKVLLEEEISGEDILNECKKLISDKTKLFDMSNAISKLANSDSNLDIYNEITTLMLK